MEGISLSGLMAEAILPRSLSPTYKLSNREGSSIFKLKAPLLLIASIEVASSCIVKDEVESVYYYIYYYDDDDDWTAYYDVDDYKLDDD